MIYVLLLVPLVRIAFLPLKFHCHVFANRPKSLVVPKSVVSKALGVGCIKMTYDPMTGIGTCILNMVR